MSSFLWFQYQCCPDNLKYNLSCWGPWGQGGKGWHQFSAKREILQNNCLDKIVVCSYGSLRTFCNFWTFLDFSNSLELFWPNGTSRSPYLKAAILDPRQSNADGSPYLLDLSGCCQWPVPWTSDCILSPSSSHRTLTAFRPWHPNWFQVRCSGVSSIHIGWVLSSWLPATSLILLAATTSLPWAFGSTASEVSGSHSCLGGKKYQEKNQPEKKISREKPTGGKKYRKRNQLDEKNIRRKTNRRKKKSREKPTGGKNIARKNQPELWGEKAASFSIPPLSDVCIAKLSLQVAVILARDWRNLVGIRKHM